MIPSAHRNIEEEFQASFNKSGIFLHQLAWIAVTGGRTKTLPEDISPVPVFKVPEVNSIGRGGLFLAEKKEALVVSAGSGTAMVAARNDQFGHVTGSAVGGGTLQGLGKLLLKTTDPQKIDAMALIGNADKADITLMEATGGNLGKLPPDANAVNFGRSARENGKDITEEDIAAGLVRMVAQVIAVIALNAARAENLDTIIFIGHLVDLESIRKALHSVAGFYNARFIIPPKPGIGTSFGALLEGEYRYENYV